MSAIAILSTENLLANLSTIKNKAPSSKIAAMIKGNAYGHGIRSVAQRLEAYVDLFGVATWDEALILRQIGIRIPILLMRGATEAQQLIAAAHENIHLVFHNETQLQWLESLTLPTAIHAWLKVDTGMGRLGFSPPDALSAYKRLVGNKYVTQPLCVYSHLACADDIHDSLNAKQIDVFKRLIEQCPGEFSLCNSAGIFNFPEHHYDFIRPGLALYGASPILNVSAQALGLAPVLTLQSQLIAVKKILKDHAIGYGSTFVTPQDMMVGIIAIGYGDGYPRTAATGTPILIREARCPLVGRVSMDLLAVDLSHCPNAAIGDCAILWGKGLPIEEIAPFTQKTPYDLLAGIQNRVKFVWQ